MKANDTVMVRLWTTTRSAALLIKVYKTKASVEALKMR
jgi:hypothetical protein